jgi:hypothetical protein
MTSASEPLRRAVLLASACVAAAGAVRAAWVGGVLRGCP